MRNTLGQRILSLFLVLILGLQGFTPAVIQAQETMAKDDLSKLFPYAKLMKKSRDCGDIFVIKESDFQKVKCSLEQTEQTEQTEQKKAENNIFVDAGPVHHPLRVFPRFWAPRRLVNGDFRSPSAKVIVRLPDEVRKQKRAADSIIEHWLLEELKTRITKRFDEDIQKIKSDKADLGDSEAREKILEVFHQLKEGILKRTFRRDSDEVKKFIIMYPDLIQEIHNTAGEDIRPLLCRYELSLHVMKMLKLSARIINGVVGLGGLVTSLVVSLILTGGVTSIPAVAISMAVFAGVSGAVDVGLNLYDYNLKVKTGNLAKNMLRFRGAIWAAIKQLEYKKEKGGTLTDGEEKLLQIFKDGETNLMKENVRGLKRIKKGKLDNQLGIVFGGLRAGTAPVNVLMNADIIPSWLELMKLLPVNLPMMNLQRE